MLPPNSVLDDKYTIECALGSGGMGTVYLAHDRVLDRHVAIKCLKRSQLELSDQQSLSREARLLAKLNHPNVVQIYDFLDKCVTSSGASNSVGIVMEYVNGETLSHYIKSKNYGIVQARLWLIQITEALISAHAKGIAHRDLKPDNILIGEDGVLKVTDFGIARLYQEPNEQQQTLHGSYASLSPEQALGQPVGLKTDYFSLGLLMYTLLVGRHPFGRFDAPAQLMHHLVNGIYQPLDEAARQVPVELVQLCNALLNKNSDARPSSLENILSVLRGESASVHVQAEESDGLDDTQPIMPVSQSDSGGFHPQAGTFTKGTHSLVPPGSSKAYTGLRHSKKLWFTVAACVIFFAVAVGIYFFKPVPPARYVALLPVSFSETADLSDHQQALLLNSISDTLEQNIIAMQGLQLISPDQVKRVKGGDADIARAVAADVLVKASLHCEAKRCEISLQRLEKRGGEQSGEAPWSLIEKQEWPILVDIYFQDLTKNITDRSQALFPKHKLSQENRTLNISEQDYRWFLEKRQSIMLEDQKTDSIWDELIENLFRFHGYAPYYKLLTVVSIQLFENTSNTQYLDQLQDLLVSESDSIGELQSIINAQFEISLKQRNYSFALLLIKKIESRNVDKHTVLGMKARYQNHKGNYADAEAIFLELIDLKPSALLWRDLAFSYRDNGRYQDGVYALSKALELDSGDLDARGLMAELYLSLGDLSKSAEQYELLISIAPRFQYLNNLGLIYELDGLYDLALKSFEQAVALAPHNSTANLNYADALRLAGKNDQAVLIYQYVLELLSESDDWIGNTERALAQVQLGQFKDAIHFIVLAQRQQPNNPELLFNAALVYTLALQFEIAKVYKQQAINQGFPELWFGLPWFDSLEK